MQVNILDAKNHLSQLIKSALAGEDVVIAKRDKPVARLVPIANPPDAEADVGSAGAILGWLKDHSLPHYARRSAEEIDTAIREERDSWD